MSICTKELSHFSGNAPAMSERTVWDLGIEEALQIGIKATVAHNNQSYQ